MSNKSGFPSVIIKMTIPAAASGVAFSNGGVSIGSLKSGRYMAYLTYALDPVNAGANITGVTAICTAFSLVGQPNAVGLLQQQVAAANAADVNSRHTFSSVFDLTVDAPVFVSIFATTSAGNYIGAINTQDSLANTISFIKLQ